MWSRRTLVTLALLVSLFCGLVVADALSDQQDQSFRCLRAFSALDGVGALTKQSAQENCHTPYFTVVNATVDLHCETEKDTTCRAALNVDLRVAEDVTERVTVALGSPDDFFTEKSRRTAWLRDIMADMPTDSSDPWRYAFTLRSLEAGTSVNYKGFDGNGFSMCCDLLTSDASPEAPFCGHIMGALGDNDMEEDAGGQIASPFRVVHHCPVPVPNANVTADTAGQIIHGRVEKPLHVRKAGAWEARLDVWRRRGEWQTEEDEDEADETPLTSDTLEGGDAERETLLRVVVRFHVRDTLWSAATEASASAPSETHDNAALQAVDGDL